MKDQPEPRCHDRAWLFTSIDRRDHETARRDCLGTDGNGPCPMFRACEQMARDFRETPWQGGLHGTWAGRLYGKKGWAA